MSIPTEVEMTSVIGTNEGRIFMVGAQDGNLYELHYQEKEGWFEKRVQLINHSVGGVQSFLPLLNTSKTSGMSGVMTYFPHTYAIQTVSFLLYPTSLGISSTHYRVTTRYPSTNRLATERCNTIKLLRTYIRRRKTRHLAALLSHHRPGKKQVEKLREMAAGNALLPNSDTLVNTPSISEDPSSIFTDSDYTPPRRSFQSDNTSNRVPRLQP